MLKYDKLFNLLKDKGITTTQIRKDNILGQRTYYMLKNRTGNLNHQSIDRLCNLLDCQPGDIMEYVEDENNV